MGENSGIAWTTHTWNPWIGCTKVSPGCDACYAEAYDARFGGKHWGSGAPRLRTTIQNWNKLKKWNRAARKSGVRPWVFVASLADIFDNEVDPEWRRDALAEMSECDALNFQIVTKRIGNAFKMLPSHWALSFAHCGLVATVVTQKECDRDLPKLLEIKRKYGVAWVGLSIEPQLERIIPKNGDGLDWIITAGESDQGGALGREYRVGWAFDLIAWGETHGVAIFVKQLGSFFARNANFKDRAGADPAEWWPPSLRVRQMPCGVPTTLKIA
ncbi:DUF5131 family protein [Methylosinus sp. Sm6]|uniref:DUF5131 family protein n=1 Tax=Methylosinus sp. Sm6 TaxID=2866948 RepID=UPI001C9A13E4|nr:DUF5131 family protein [Methylosinus sp. Sm6]MBY6244169.1 phage Gp37/Gp68 family protein [Methylosinus sp. Sm6]